MALEVKANIRNKPKKWVKHMNPVNWGKGIGRTSMRSWHFIKDSISEMKRITWPEKNKVYRSTGVVISAVALITAFIWLIDSIFNQSLVFFIKLLK